jgi:predicted PurR-regulated permease PerM
MHELLIFFGVLGGLDAFGVIGVILGPVVIAVTLALLEIVQQAGRPAPMVVPAGPASHITSAS